MLETEDIYINLILKLLQKR